MLKLNMGCGRRREPGYVNVDSVAAAEPDQVVDLEQTPWPWPDNSAEAVLFNHSLEHMGGDPAVFLAMMQELYRICAPGAVVTIRAPHPRHDHFLGDPTHVRPVTADMLGLFDRELNDRNLAAGHADTPFAHYLGVDFKTTRAVATLDEPWATQLKTGELSAEAANLLVRTQYNIVRQLTFELLVRKPAQAG